MVFIPQRALARSVAALRSKAPSTPSQRTLTLLRSPFHNRSATAACKAAATSAVCTRSLPATSNLAINCRSRQFHSSPVVKVDYKISVLSDDEYHNVADNTMDAMVEYFEDLGDSTDFPGFDVEYQSGVMTLKLGDKGTYVVNKQPPNKQLWLSSPLSGPKRYDYDTEHKVWFYTRDHHSLHWLLNHEISEALGIDIHVPFGNDDDQ
ncbi:Mitochondrial chaperone Frataxin [Actinomortierella ambigua]|uniref:ferroxidase n=1 Tax=Actinomortierella ambigua TaxID=1343610 RepID=A0A9P6U8E7_9FUNG|nr:Mitochondrial chaperone Frataxin [Actinomortierella ambigua]